MVPPVTPLPEVPPVEVPLSRARSAARISVVGQPAVVRRAHVRPPDIAPIVDADDDVAVHAAAAGETHLRVEDARRVRRQPCLRVGAGRDAGVGHRRIAGRPRRRVPETTPAAACERAREPGRSDQQHAATLDLTVACRAPDRDLGDDATLRTGRIDHVIGRHLRRHQAVHRIFGDGDAGRVGATLRRADRRRTGAVAVPRADFAARKQQQSGGKDRAAPKHGLILHHGPGSGQPAGKPSVASGAALRRMSPRSTEKCRARWGCSSAGRAPESHSGGRRFDPVHLHEFISVFLQFRLKRPSGNDWGTIGPIEEIGFRRRVSLRPAPPSTLFCWAPATASRCA